MIKTQGNPDRHIVLRGGARGPNHAAEDVVRAAELVAAESVARPIMVDCSHDNSGKDHTRQAAVCREVLAQLRIGQSALMGLLLESNLYPGKQTWTPGGSMAYGVSITDACMGWDETELLLYEIADAVGSAPSAAVSA
jgi:3-deoxy-7-phosphoheptulonate synthase